MSSEVAEFIGKLIDASHAQSFGIMNDLYEVERNTRITIQALIIEVLDSVPYGGTTAQYEKALNTIEKNLYPSNDLIEKTMQRIGKH